jgi:hypothetical protein
MEEKLVCAHDKTNDRRSGSGETKRKEDCRLSALVITREERKRKNQKIGRGREKKKKRRKD